LVGTEGVVIVRVLAIAVVAIVRVVTVAETEATELDVVGAAVRAVVVELAAVGVLAV